MTSPTLVETLLTKQVAPGVIKATTNDMNNIAKQRID